ncbi:hypothetical protein HYH03_005752 [Edaphochlamys debaryana]|uniref:F-box domain-containing protein n=1 Tax=Edaphochlamys debaryana TaxID=47281 RepID=A0A836C0X0_9CHLO|nr:hypothetical protein HYH03_005752 [Edaphochlamys debaryana]|eukprot:KAG2496150.1 hypothetical protein HYH03_005752 [Edaphochlamys debaryana]
MLLALGDTTLPPTHTEPISSLPALVLEAIWSQLSYAARCSLRATCRALRRRVDEQLLRSAVALTAPPAPAGRNSGSTGAGSGPACGSSSGVGAAQSSPAPALDTVGGCGLLWQPGDDGVRLAALPSEAVRLLHLHPASPNDQHRTVQRGLCNPATHPDTSCSDSDSPERPFTVVLGGGPVTGTNAGPTGPSPRFCGLASLVLVQRASSTPPASPTGWASYGASVRHALPPPCAALLSAFGPSRALTRLALVGLTPGPTERDVEAIASSFPDLASLAILAAPAPNPGGRGPVAPPLTALRTCHLLRSLSLDLGRGGVVGPAARASLGLLTQLSSLTLGLGGGDDDPPPCSGAAGVGIGGRGAAAPMSPGGSPAREGCASGCGCGCGGAEGRAVLTGGGVAGSLYRLAWAGLRSLELRVVSFGACERRLLQAVAAGAEDAAACAAASAAAAEAVAAAGGGLAVGSPARRKSSESSEGSASGGCSWAKTSLSTQSSSSSASTCNHSPPPRSPAAAAAADTSTPTPTGLERLALRLMPSPAHAAPSSASFAATALGGSAGLGGAFGGGGLGGADVAATPSASLCYGPLALGAATSGQGGGVGWAQPSESEGMLAALRWMRGLRSLQLPDLLLTSAQQLRPLSVLTALTALRIGGVASGGVRPSANGPLAGLRRLAVEAECPAYGGGVPWWSVLCPSLERLTLTLQYGSSGGQLGARHDGAAGAAAAAAAEPLARALAAVAEVRLVLCAVTAWGSGAAAAGSTTAAAGRGSGDGLSALRRDLPVLLGAAAGSVRHLELYLDAPTEVASALPEDLLTPLTPPPLTAQAQRHRDGGSGGDYSPGLRSLRVLTVGGVWGLVLPAAPPAAASAAATLAALVCRRLAAVLRSATPPLGCLCVVVPGLWEAALVGQLGPGASEPQREAAATVEELARAAAEAGTRLCLCGVGGGVRAAVLRCWDRRGVGVVEGWCEGCRQDPPVHALP